MVMLPDQRSLIAPDVDLRTAAKRAGGRGGREGGLSVALGVTKAVVHVPGHGITNCTPSRCAPKSR